MSDIHRTYSVVELKDRFGFNRDTHLDASVGKLYLDFAKALDEVLPESRTKSLAFTELEASSMWAHKTIATLLPPNFHASNKG